MKTSEQINELATALAMAQGELTDATKDQKAHQYKYADLAQVLGIVRPIFSKHGLAVVQAATMIETDVCVTTRIMHASGQWIEETLPMPAIVSKAMSPAQAVGSVITYARRYSLAAMAGLTQADNDAAGESVGEGEIVAVKRRTSVRAQVMEQSGKPPDSVEAYFEPLAEAIANGDVAGFMQLKAELDSMHENAYTAVYDLMTPNKQGKADYLQGQGEKR